MNSKPIRWGLVSTANINRVLIPAIRESKRGELVAVASRSQESADAYAKKMGNPHPPFVQLSSDAGLRNGRRRLHQPAQSSARRVEH